MIPMIQLMAYLGTDDITHVHREGCPALHPARLADSKHASPYPLAELSDGGAVLVHIDSLLSEFTEEDGKIHHKGADTGWTIREHPANGRIIATDPDGRTHGTRDDSADLREAIASLVPNILHDLAHRRAEALRAKLSAEVYRDMIAEGSMGTADAEQHTRFAQCTGLDRRTLYYPHAPMLPRCEDVEPVVYHVAVAVLANLPADTAAEAIRKLSDAVTRAGFTVFEPFTGDGADRLEISQEYPLGATVAEEGTDPSRLPRAR